MDRCGQLVDQRADPSRRRVADSRPGGWLTDPLGDDIFATSVAYATPARSLFFSVAGAFRRRGWIAQGPDQRGLPARSERIWRRVAVRSSVRGPSGRAP